MTSQTYRTESSKARHKLPSFCEQISSLCARKSVVSGARAQVKSVLKFSAKRGKDMGITYSNFSKAKAKELEQEKASELVKAEGEESLRPRSLSDMDVQREKIISSLKWATRGPTAMVYANQRSTKKPLREPSQFPYNLNFSQRVIDDFQDEGTEENGFHDFKAYPDFDDPQESVSCCAVCSTPILSMPEFPPPLLGEIRDGLGLLQPSQATSASNGVSSTPHSTLLTPGLTFSESAPTPPSNGPPSREKSLRTETPGKEFSSHMGEGSSSVHVFGLGSPWKISPPIAYRRGPGAALLASLDSLERICAGKLNFEDSEERADV